MSAGLKKQRILDFMLFLHLVFDDFSVHDPHFNCTMKKLYSTKPAIHKKKLCKNGVVTQDWCAHDSGALSRCCAIGVRCNIPLNYQFTHYTSSSLPGVVEAVSIGESLWIVVRVPLQPLSHVVVHCLAQCSYKLWVIFGI